ncbi:POK6 protein, partial [Chloropsis hardwickii]|nr:POK6 protein [Chloropsis hardwickii]
MGALQPGLPAPTMIPQNWQMVVIDLKDCFFTIPLHPDDTHRFAFTVLTVQPLLNVMNGHEMFHQNAKSLHRHYRIPIADAKGIVHSCPQCSHYGAGIG